MSVRLLGLIWNFIHNQIGALFLHQSLLHIQNLFFCIITLVCITEPGSFMTCDGNKYYCSLGSLNPAHPNNTADACVTCMYLQHGNTFDDF